MSEDKETCGNCVGVCAAYFPSAALRVKLVVIQSSQDMLNMRFIVPKFVARVDAVNGCGFLNRCFQYFSHGTCAGSYFKLVDRGRPSTNIDPYLSSSYFYQTIINLPIVLNNTSSLKYRIDHKKHLYFTSLHKL